MVPSELVSVGIARLLYWTTTGYVYDRHVTNITTAAVQCNTMYSTALHCTVLHWAAPLSSAHALGRISTVESPLMLGSM